MTATEWDFLPKDRHELRLRRNIGDAFAELLKTVHPHNTAKAAARRFNIDVATAQNAVKGKAGATAVTKAVHAEGEEAWALWDALGQLIIGESRDAYEERKLREIIESTENARKRTVTRLERRAALVESAHFADPLRDRKAS